MLFVAFCVAIVVVGGCSKKEKPVVEATLTLANAQPRIVQALEEMLRREAGAFVIIIETRTEKYVQFAGSDDVEDPLLLDLPWQPLSPQEHARAREIFAHLSERAEVESGFQLELDRDPQQGADLALRVLREVYHFGDDAELALIEE